MHYTVITKYPNHAEMGLIKYIRKNPSHSPVHTQYIQLNCVTVLPHVGDILRLGALGALRAAPAAARLAGPALFRPRRARAGARAQDPLHLQGATRVELQGGAVFPFCCRCEEDVSQPVNFKQNWLCHCPHLVAANYFFVLDITKIAR